MHGAVGPPVVTMHGPVGPSVAAVHGPGGQVTARTTYGVTTPSPVGAAADVPLVDVPLSCEVDCDDPARSMNTKLLHHSEKFLVGKFLLLSVSTQGILILEYTALALIHYCA